MMQIGLKKPSNHSGPEYLEMQNGEFVGRILPSSLDWKNAVPPHNPLGGARNRTAFSD
ncbi:MAG: hypothetical protein ACXAES_17895 [Promethearchaeota archaeon]